MIMTAKLTNRLGIACPYCGSAAGDVCRNGKGERVKVHSPRLRPDGPAKGPGRPKGVYYTKTLAGPAELASQLQLADCPKCGAKPFQPCRDGRGHATNPHDGRPYEESDPPETTMTPNPQCRRCGSSQPPLIDFKQDVGILCKPCVRHAILRCYGVDAKAVGTPERSGV